MDEKEFNKLFLRISVLFFIAGILTSILAVSLVKIFNLQNEFPLEGIIYSRTNTAPSNLINENDIEIYPDKVVIKINNPSLSRYAATGSMLPVLNEDSNGIRIAPKSEDEIDIGDIITFEQNNLLIVHRVVDKSRDEQGTYFITKGDNAVISDGKIRFKDIKYKTIVLIY